MLVVLGFFTCGFQLAFITVHFQKYIVEAGLSPSVGYWAFALVGLFNIVGSLTAGYFSGRMPRRYILSFIYFSRSLVTIVFLLMPPSAASAYMFGALSGLLWLSTVPPTSGIIGQMFGTRYFAMLFGFAFFSHQVGGFLGVLLGGVLREATGSYNIVWCLSVALGVASALINLPVVEKPVVRKAEAAAADPARRRTANVWPSRGVLSRRRRMRRKAWTFKAVRIDKDDAGYRVGFADFDDSDLMDGDVTVRVTHSTVNYKDGLALTGKSPVVRHFPMIPGIDFAGVVEAPRIRDFKPGDKVILNGWGVGETHFGGYAREGAGEGRLARASAGRAHAGAGHGDRHRGLHRRCCALMALERHGVTPDMRPGVVTGAAGGVGSVAIALLAEGRLARDRLHGAARRRRDYLKGLGADEILDRNELDGRRRARSPRSAGPAGIDAVGSHHARERPRDDEVRRRDRRLRPCSRHGPADLRGALHPARRLAPRRSKACKARSRSASRPGAASRKSSTRQARGDDDDVVPRRRRGRGRANPQGQVRGRVVVDIG